MPDRQLSLAIGKEGQNARLAAKLTGWRIDIKSESEAMKEGLDRLAAEQAQAGHRPTYSTWCSASSTTARNRSRAKIRLPVQPGAGGIRQQVAAPEETGESGLPVEMPDISADRESLQAMWPSEEELPPEPVSFQEPPDFEVELEGAADEEIEAPEAEETAEQAESEEPALADLTMGDELPEVITADMLRARRNVNVDMDDFEIPAELLAGLDEEDWGRRGRRGRSGEKGQEQSQGQAQKPVSPKRRPSLRSAAVPSGMMTRLLLDL